MISQYKQKYEKYLSTHKKLLKYISKGYEDSIFHRHN